MSAPLVARADPEPSASIDLGASVLSNQEAAVGPFHAALGLGDRLMIGTYTFPWLTTILASGSVVPNGFVKLGLFRRGPVSVAAKTTLFHVRLNDIDDDELKVRGWIWPSQLLVEGRWPGRWATLLEVTAVHVRASGSGLADNDTKVHGVALANNVHAGLIQRLRVARGLELWGRFRALLDHAPVVAEAGAELSDSARISVRARANSAELTSGYAAMAGAHWQWRKLVISGGVGYGTWILPWIYLPVGKRTVSAELDVYVRF